MFYGVFFFLQSRLARIFLYFYGVNIKIRRMKEKKKQGYYDSMAHFKKTDGNKYAACTKQVFDMDLDIVLEWRICIETGRFDIIHFYEDGNGYEIYKS